MGVAVGGAWQRGSARGRESANWQEQVAARRENYVRCKG